VEGAQATGQAQACGAHAGAGRDPVKVMNSYPFRYPFEADNGPFSAIPSTKSTAGDTPQVIMYSVLPATRGDNA
jgi:hypothetical protein